MASAKAVLAAILIAAGGPAFGARWSAIDGGLPSTGPGIASVAVDPITPSTLYALSVSGFIFKSVDAGTNWRLSSGVAGVRSLAIDPKNPSTIYLTTNHGMVKSTDRGESWNNASDGLPDFYPISIVIDPVDPSTLYALTVKGIFKSSDGGGIWNALRSSGLPGGPLFGPLIVDPITSSTLYALHSNGLNKSTDGGVNWNTINPTFESRYSLTCLALDPVNPSTIYAGFFPQAFTPPGQSPTGGVFKSTDGGKTWNALQSGVPDTFFVTSLVIDPVTPSTIYAGVTSNRGAGIVKSTNAGESWNAVNDGLPDSFRGSIVIDPITPSILYASYSDRGTGAIFKSEQGGGKWKRADGGMGAIDARALAIDPKNGTTLYAGVGDSVFKKADGAANWSKLVSFELHNSFSLSGGPPLSGPAPAYPRTLVVDFDNPNVLYTWTNRYNGCIVFDKLLFKSNDSGATWNDSVAPPDNPCVVDGFLVMDPTDPNTLYVVESNIFGGGYWIRKSINGGATWTQAWYSEELGPAALVIDPANPSTLYAGTGRGAFTSADGGANWREAGLNERNVTALVLDPTGPGVLYAATGGAYPEPQGFRGLFKSIDRGVSWSEAGEGLAGLTGAGVVITSLVTTRDNRNLLYAGTSGDGVYKSLDGGANWVKFNEGLTNLEIRVLTADPKTSTTLYVTTGGGIFKIVDDISK